MSDEELQAIPLIPEDEPTAVVTWPKPQPVENTATDIVVAETPREPLTTRLSGCAVPISILFAAVLIAAAILMSGGGGTATPNHDVIQETVDDTTPVIDTVDAFELKQCRLIVIADKNTENESVEYALTLQDDTFWKSAEARVADYEVLDPSDAIAAAFLKTIQMPPPIVTLIKPDKNSAWVIPLPKGTTKPIQEALDGR